ncbi:MAG: 50S ribosomal protein L29 [Proteobacteria bacterium]|nr:50S ribosomal protein L29 [Pseudomonadota bacterium]
MIAQGYRDMSDEEIDERDLELRRSLFNLRVRNATKELENTSQMRFEKREMARLLTVRRERELAKAAAASAE